ncbi:hypothetical protein G8764_07795 [Pseudomaricurvus alcaniphilus]|uniref:hypothetical protein n=1 Tax=Pseudomaricurvus alcaniphilus TaxID=1166482 RepID=UPI0014095977|nr:hypothetical protein [Pseudomaricurvus alcaniphilus]NHN37190.1 hypothetical protein [Pseudomaricurvus alcaniphilus]
MNEKNPKKQLSNEAVIVLGMSFGAAIGAAIGAYTGNVALFVSLGTCFGTASGFLYLWLNSKQDSRNK